MHFRHATPWFQFGPNHTKIYLVYKTISCINICSWSILTIFKHTHGYLIQLNSIHNSQNSFHYIPIKYSHTAEPGLGNNQQLLLSFSFFLIFFGYFKLITNCQVRRQLIPSGQASRCIYEYVNDSQDKLNVPRSERNEKHSK